ncbi:unnamed protein product [Diamesa serratosioi]
MELKTKSIYFVFLKVLVLVLLVTAIIVAGVISYTDAKTESKSGGAVVTNGLECAKMGASILKNGGSVADAAVTTILCEGITCPQSTGLGGGFLLTIYIKETQTVEILNAREVAPKLATSNMYVNNSLASVTGGLAIAVPGELKGLWALHQKYGKLSWKDLIQPNIDLCRNGHLVSPYLVNIFKGSEQRLLDEPSLREIYINPKTNKAWQLGERVKREQLAKSLEIIAIEGADAIYNNGSLAKDLINDIKNFGGIITEEDLLDYRVRWGKPERSDLPDNKTLYTFPLPATGSVLIFMLNILKKYDLKHDALSYHLIAEAFKFAYAKRSVLGDEPSDRIKEMVRNLTSTEYSDYIRDQINEDYTSDDLKYYGASFANQQDHGTAHMSILAPNGDAIAVTGTINNLLGSFRRSQSTGIILNDEMDDFSTPGYVNVYGIPASPANFIQPGKNPLSSMTPTIILDKNHNARMIIGGAGGSRITTGVAFTIIQHLFMNQTLKDSIDARRIHHQLTPMELLWETNFDNAIVDELSEKFKHKIKENKPDGGFAAVVGIAQVNGIIEGAVDPRRGGSIEIF